jgi:hypothetical protein
VLGFGVRVTGLPGDWPSSTGAERYRMPWSIVDEPFDTSGDWWFKERADGLTVRFLDEGEFRVHTAPRPRVEVVLGPTSEREAAVAFVLAVLPLCLPLFGLEPFHGAALEVPGKGALLVTGYPEAGKSTTAAALRELGLRFLADDACALDDRGSLWPGPALLSTRSATQEPFARFDSKNVVEIDRHEARPVPLCAMVVLESGENEPDIQIDAEDGPGAIRTVLSQLRSTWVLPGLREPRQLPAAARVAGTPVGRVRFQKGAHTPQQVARAILAWLQSAASTGHPPAPR